MPVPIAPSSLLAPPIVLIYLKLHNSQSASVLSISFDLYDNPTGQNLSVMFFSGEEPKAPERGIKFPKVTQLASDGVRTHPQDLSQSAWAPLAFSALLWPSLPSSFPRHRWSTYCGSWDIPALEELMHGRQQVGRVVSHCATQGMRERTHRSTGEGSRSVSWRTCTLEQAS